MLHQEITEGMVNDMGRLIDADALIEHLSTIKTLYGVPMTSRDEQMLHWIIGHIKNFDIAYDVEKVVAELEEMIKPKQFYFCKYAKGGCKYIDDDKKDCMECVVEHAIDIVRKGGVE